jgi:GAF domain-containing protein
MFSNPPYNASSRQMSDRFSSDSSSMRHLSEQLTRLREQPYVPSGQSADHHLRPLSNRLATHLERDNLVQATTDQVIQALQCDRVVIYYFYYEWKGQVTFEALSHPRYSIFGSTGADDCFNDEYAAQYLEGRDRSIADVETADIHPCHRDFLRSIQVRANLVVPIISEKESTKRLWGLLIAHYCDRTHDWTADETQIMWDAAHQLSHAPSIQKL